MTQPAKLRAAYRKLVPRKGLIGRDDGVRAHRDGRGGGARRDHRTTA